MSEHDSFEDRLRAMADEISRSVQRFTEVDLDRLADRYGVDADRARAFADAAGSWLSEQLTGAEPLFGQSPGTPASPRTPTPPEPAAKEDPGTTGGKRGGDAHPGPHPLDLPTEHQGLALSALDSRRWAVRPGSSRLAGTGDGPPPPDLPDLVSDLRARDWITPDGTLTLVGRHALARWCRATEDAAGSATPPAPDAPTP